MTAEVLHRIDEALVRIASGDHATGVMRRDSGREFALNYRSDRSLTGDRKYFFANRSRHFDRR